MNKVVERDPLCKSDEDHSLVDRLVIDDCSTLPNTKLSLPTTPTSEATSDCIVGSASSSAVAWCTIDVAPIMDPVAIKPFKAIELGASILEWLETSLSFLGRKKEAFKQATRIQCFPDFINLNLVTLFHVFFSKVRMPLSPQKLFSLDYTWLNPIFNHFGYIYALSQQKSHRIDDFLEMNSIFSKVEFYFAISSNIFSMCWIDFSRPSK